MKKIYVLDSLNLLVSFFFCRWFFMEYLYFEMLRWFGFPAAGLDFWRPLTAILILTLLMFTALRLFYRRKPSPHLIRFLYLLYGFLIFYALIWRSSGVKGFNLNLITYFQDAVQIDFKVPFLNLLLFVPLGLLFSPTFKKVGLFLLGITLIESLQYVFQLGFFDLGDILFNSLGFILGNILHTSFLGRLASSALKVRRARKTREDDLSKRQTDKFS